MNKINYSKQDLIKFIIVSILYLAWVIWVDWYWLLLGLIIIFDYYITKFVNWTFWKKRNQKNSKIIEWIDAIIFAVIAVTFINIFFFQNYKIPTGSMEKTLLVGDHLYVSKMAYGPRIPNTPIAFPFAQHTLPLTKKTKSYVEWIKIPYKRLKGFGHVKRDDIVVFNFPEGDTVVIQNQSLSYYHIVRDSAEMLKKLDKMYGKPLKSEKEYYAIARDRIWKNFDIVVRPVDKKDNYIKRCVAIPGDTLQIIDGQIYVNGKPQKYIKTLQHYYDIIVKPNSFISDKTLERLDINEYYRYPGTPHLTALISFESLEKLKKFSSILMIKKNQEVGNTYNINYFPHDTAYKWTLDNFGPIYIPKKGDTITLNLNNLCLYERIIDIYENNDLKVVNGKIFINGKETTKYVFKMDYYWMMGDNRHSSLDSRYWGFVPEDHIVGKPRIIWLSIDKNKNFLKKIRWNRMFKIIKP